MGTRIRSVALRAGCLALAAAGIGALIGGGAPQAAAPQSKASDPPQRFPLQPEPQVQWPGLTKRDAAAFLDQAAINFVRPGLKVKIVSASIAQGTGVITANVTITDNAGLPLDRLGVTTPGPVSVSFVPAYLPNNNDEYVDYSSRNVTSTLNGSSATQATADSGGTWTTISTGQYTYTFGTKAPNFDPTATQTIGLYASRNLTEFDAGTQYSNDEFSWVPNGSPVTHVHSIVSNNACNQCHDPLAAHGGSRQDVALCVLCHTTQTTDPDTGNTVDFRVMIHKIHMGVNLPSVQAGKPYQIIGFQNSVNDFSDVVFPAEGPNNCQFCHAPVTQSNPPPAQANAWLTSPSRAACGACHDDVNFDTGENHPGGPQANDNSCSQCHVPQGATEFDTSIVGAHTIPRFSTQLAGVVFTIPNISNGAPGQNPQVTFTLKDKAGNAIPPASMNLLNLILAYPTTDYSTAITEDARKATANADGSYTYTFKAAIPGNATGTGTIGIEGYRNATINENATQATVRDVGQNVDVPFSITAVQQRRTVVTTQNCDSCHFRLQAHGTIRNEISHCVLCHNPNATDTPFRPADQMPPQGIAFKMMVHRIHTGEDQQSDYTIYGFGGSQTNFMDVAFPGDRRDCEKCHVPNSQELPLPPGLLNVVNPRGFINPEGPATAACLGCHTDQATAAHASQNTDPNLGEACAVCHGTGAAFSVDMEHAR